MVLFAVFCCNQHIIKKQQTEVQPRRIIICVWLEGYIIKSIQMWSKLNTITLKKKTQKLFSFQSHHAGFLIKCHSLEWKVHTAAILPTYMPITLLLCSDVTGASSQWGTVSLVAAHFWKESNVWGHRQRRKIAIIVYWICTDLIK